MIKRCIFKLPFSITFVRQRVMIRLDFSLNSESYINIGKLVRSCVSFINDRCK